MAGRILREVRSPVAPKMTIAHGSGTRSRSNPERSGFSAGASSRRCRCTDAGGGVVALVVPGAVRALLLVANELLRLDRVAAELLAECGQHTCPVALLLATAEAGHEAGGNDQRRDVEIDRLLDGPTAFAGILDPATDVAQLLAVLLERAAEQLEQPRPDHRAVHPRLGDRGKVQRVLRLVQDLEALGVRLHQPVLDAVVDHLHVVTGTRWSTVDVAAGFWRQRPEYGLERLHGVFVATHHHAVAVDHAPDAAADAGIDKLDATFLEHRVATL